jgi:alpha-tubulin suppressor-like RCC1 family protein
VDECAAGTDDCHADADCANTVGSFTCICRLGFEGDGRSCTPAATCPPGFSFEGPNCRAAWRSIRSGGHSCGLLANGALYCWGSNPDGRLGLPETTTVADRPTRVGSNLWKQISTGAEHTCGVRDDDTLWCVGQARCGRIGNGSVEDCSDGDEPLFDWFQTGGTRPWRSVSAGSRHTCAIDGDRALWCFGRNSSAELGLGDASDLPRNLTPAQVDAAGNKDWQEVSAGGSHTCARRSGALYCWGSNSSGQAGQANTAADVLVPTPVGSDADWTAVVTGGNHSCGLRGTNLYCWGFNSQGQIGDGTTMTRTAPTPIRDDIDWAEVAVGPSTTCARAVDGSWWCWGDNTNQAAGDGLPLSYREPRRVGTGVGWRAIGGGGPASCAIDDNARLFCFGSNQTGTLGVGPLPADLTVPADINAGTGWAQVEAGTSSTCAIKTDGSLWCWGSNSSGQLGHGVAGRTRDRPTVVMEGTSFRKVSVGNSSACAITTADVLYCWGDDSFGKLGNGSPEADLGTPTQIPSTGSTTRYLDVASYFLHTCAITKVGAATTGQIFCWGLNARHQCGANTTTSPLYAPTLSADTASTWTNLIGGNAGAACAVRSANVYCWGYNQFGNVGNNTAEGTNVAIPALLGPGGSWTIGSIGDYHTLGLRGGLFYAWGYNTYGALGNNATLPGANAAIPTNTNGSSWTAIAAGGNTSCGVRADGELLCWGQALPDGASSSAAGGLGTGPWSNVSVGTRHACGLKVDGSIACWGEASLGKLGNGLIWYETPTRVREP